MTSEQAFVIGGGSVGGVKAAVTLRAAGLDGRLAFVGTGYEKRRTDSARGPGRSCPIGAVKSLASRTYRSRPGTRSRSCVIAVSDRSSSGNP